MSRSTTSLHPQTPWLFAFGAVAIGLGVGYLARGLSPKINAAIYAAIVGAAGFGSMYLSRARLRTAVLAFLVAGAACAGLYYFLVSSVVRDATTTLTDAASGGEAHAAGVQAGSTFGKFFGIFAAVIAFLETFIGGVIGASMGNRARGEQGTAVATGLARAAGGSR